MRIKTKILIWIFCLHLIPCRKRDSPAERRVEEKFRGEQRSSEGIRSGSFRDRNERVERNDRNERVERGGRQSPRGPRQDRERIDRRPEPDFRRDRRDDGANQQEWRGRAQAQGTI